MKEMIKKLMVVLLSAFMFMGVMTTPVQAKGHGSGGGKGNGGWPWPWGWGWQEPTQPEPDPESEPVVEEPVAEEESADVSVEEEPAEMVYPALSLDTTEETSGIAVAVEAPEGSLPEGTDLEVSKVSADAVETAAAQVVDGTITDIAAVDISFVNSNEEIEPAEGTEVAVTITVPALIDNEIPKLIHIKDDGSIEEILNAQFDQIGGTVTFAAGTFSTYALVWTVDGTEQSAQIHWGTMENGTWKEFNNTYIDDSTGVFGLRGLYEGYTYSRAYYSTSELTNPESGTPIEGTLVRTEDDIWQYGEYAHFENKNNIADGSHIYAVYIPNEDVVTPPAILPPSEPDPLSTKKSVTANKNADNTPDGTYRITLSVTGAVEDQTQTEITSANVVVIIDRSWSMRENMGGAAWSTVKNAAMDLVDAMPTEAKVDINVFQFSRNYTSGNDNSVSWTSLDSEQAKTAVKNRINGFAQPGNNDMATNWDAALARANTVAGQKNDGDPTYIIFLTDGCPSVNQSNNDSHGSAGTTNWQDRCISNALTNMQTLVGNSYRVYGIYAHDDNQGDTSVTVPSGRPNAGTYENPLAYIISASGAAGYFKAENTEQVNSIFESLITTITNSIGYGNVAVNDGVTNLTDVSASVSVSGAAGEFHYYRKGGTVKDLNGVEHEKYDSNANDGLGVEWPDAPAASSSGTGVTWDLSSIGNLEKGVTYTVWFDIWPSQDAYDLVADLNNGKKYVDYTAYHNAGGQLTEEEALAQGIVISEDVAAQVGGEGPNGYYLKTNTFLNTSYTHSGKEYIVNGDEGDNDMPLEAEKITLKKLWPENLIDRYGEGDYADGEGGTAQADQITLTITKDGVPYVDKVLKKPSAQASGWVPEEGDDELFISCGLMTVKDGVAEIKGTSTGHDYSVIEPASFSYYWDLIAPVYHPMVINGKKTLLVLDESLDSADNVNSFEINGKIYKKANSSSAASDDDLVLEAENFRRSHINLRKEIVDPCDNSDKALFTYKIRFTIPNAKQPGEEGYDPNTHNVWFSAWDPKGGEQGTGAVVINEFQPTGSVEKELKNGQPTGYWFAHSGAEFTIQIKAGWNIQFRNVVHDTTYTIEETGMGSGFTFNSITYEGGYAAAGDTNWGSITGQTFEGTVEKPNSSYTVTFKNNYTAYFYVYHSSDNTIERISNNDAERITTGNDGEMIFNIANEVKTGYLYGGYYSAYEDAGMDEDAIKTATYDQPGVSGGEYRSTISNSNWIEDSDGVSYIGGPGKWQKSNAITENGTSMKPKANTVYYLKEVPDVYLTPATYVVYDSHDFDENGAMQVKKLHLMSLTDDMNYKNAGFDVVHSSGIKDDDGFNGFFNADYWDEQVTVTKDGQSDPYAIIKSSSIVSNKAGYVVDVDITKNYIVEKAYYKEVPYHITLDNVKVTAIKQLLVNLKNTRFKNWEKTGMTKTGLSKKALYAYVES